MSQTAISTQKSREPLNNPIGTNGFEFVEFAAPDHSALQKLFETLGFRPIAKHKKQNIVLYRQGEINFIINSEPGSFAASFMSEHGPCACAMGFRVEDAKLALQKLVDRGAEPYQANNTTFNVPAIRGIGGSIIYLIDSYNNGELYKQDFESLSNSSTEGVGLTYLDHLTHNVYHGGMDKWAEFYEKLFNFREIRYFDIRGKKTGLLSRAMTSPCEKIRIPINEGTEESSQIEEYLQEYKGEGIQHIAFGTNDIYATVESLRRVGIEFLTVPDTYYELLDDRLPGHGEDYERMKRNRILIDGDMQEAEKPLLLQIFTKTLIGPIFFEIIQRKGHQGFGEGNFQALFEAMELDQIRRGVL